MATSRLRTTKSLVAAGLVPEEKKVSLEKVEEKLKEFIFTVSTPSEALLVSRGQPKRLWSGIISTAILFRYNG